MKKFHTLSFTFILACSIAFGQNWSFFDVDRGVKPALEVDNNGIVHIAYMLEAFPGFVRHAKWNGVGFDLTLITEAYFYGPLDIAIDADNLPHIAIHDHDLQDQVHHFQDANGDWKNNVIQDSGHDGWDNRLFIDKDGMIHASSVDPSSGIEYSFFNGNSWTTESTGSPRVSYAGATSLAVDSNKYPYITYYNDGQENLAMLCKKNGTWSNEIIDAEGDVGQFSSIVIAPNDDIYISYYQHLGNGVGLIKFAQRKNNDWSISVVDTLNDVRIAFTGARNMTSLRLDASNKLHLAYSDQKTVKYAFFDGNKWIKEVVLDLVGQAISLGQQTTLGIANDNSLHISYYEISNLDPLDGQIKYATRQLSTVTTELTTSIKTFDVFPNPVQHYISIDYDLKHTQGQLKLVNIQGKQLSDYPLNKSGLLQIEMAGLSSGIYFLNLIVGDQKVSRKIVKH